MGYHIEGDCTHETYLMRARRASLAQENVGMVIKILPPNPTRYLLQDRGLRHSWFNTCKGHTFQLQETGLFVARISYL